MRRFMWLTLWILFEATATRAGQPTPLSIQVYGDQNFQRSELPILDLGVIPPVVFYHVYAYDLPESTQGLRFRLELSDPSLDLTFEAASPWISTIVDGDFLLEAQAGCVAGTGKVRLGGGSILLPDWSIYDLELCMLPIVTVPPGESGLDVRACGDSTWTALHLQYEGCSVANPRILTPPVILDNDFNVMILEETARAVGSPLSTQSSVLARALELRKVANPNNVGRVVIRWTWDPTIATFNRAGPMGTLPPDWTENVLVSPGQATLTLEGSTPWSHSNSPSTNEDFLELALDLGPYRGQSPLTIDISVLADTAGVPIDFMAPSETTIRVTCRVGDVDGNSRFSSLDALMALRVVAGLDPVLGFNHLCRIDANDNHEADAGDVVLILRRAVGILFSRSLESARSTTSTNAAPELQIHDDGAELILSLSQAAAIDLQLTLGPEHRFDSWHTDTEFLSSLNTGNGKVHLVMARTENEPAEVRLNVRGIRGEATIESLRVWNSAGQLTLEISDQKVTLGSESGPPPSSMRSTHLLPCVPNPFNPRTRIRFQSLRGGDFEISILDLRGRVVRSVAIKAQYGLNQWSWNGTDNSGHPVASGAYRVHLRHGSQSWSESVVLVR